MSNVQNEHFNKCLSLNLNFKCDSLRFLNLPFFELFLEQNPPIFALICHLHFLGTAIGFQVTMDLSQNRKSDDPPSAVVHLIL